MKITLKLYAKLGKYLPKNTSKNQAIIEIEENCDVQQALDKYGVPSDQRHLVMVNGVHIMREDRTTRVLAESDSIAVWPQLKASAYRSPRYTTEWSDIPRVNT